MARDQAKRFCLVVIVTACCVRSFFVFLCLSYSLCHSHIKHPSVLLYIDSPGMQGPHTCVSDTHCRTSFGIWLDFQSGVCIGILLRVQEKRWIVLWDQKHRCQPDMDVVCAYLHQQLAFLKSLTQSNQVTEDRLCLHFTKSDHLYLPLPF